MTLAMNISLPSGWSKTRPMKWFSTYAHGRLGQHKAWEWQTDYFGWTSLFSLRLDLIPTGSDHASLGVSLTILGFMVDAKIYDSRHWDDEANTWEKYDEESQYYRMARDEREREDRLELARQLLKDETRTREIRSAEEYLAGPQGQAMIARLVDTKLAEQRDSREAKRARGEAYRRDNLGDKI